MKTEYVAQLTCHERGIDIAIFVNAMSQAKALELARKHFNLKGGQFDADAGFLVLNGGAQLLTITEKNMMDMDFIRRRLASGMKPIILEGDE